MGYTTDFEGNFKITFKDEVKMNEAFTLVNGLALTRRMKRDLSKLNGLPNIIESYGVDGEFYWKDDKNSGQSNDCSVIDNNQPPSIQPSLWLQWIITKNEIDGSYNLEWDHGEKFYGYIEWLDYLITKVFEPNQITLNGEVDWEGEESDDTGTITVVDNIISID
jgi:hypothetical protein